MLVTESGSLIAQGEITSFGDVMISIPNTQNLGRVNVRVSGGGGQHTYRLDLALRP